MKKIFLIFFTLLLVFCLFSCDKPDTIIENPIRENDTFDAPDTVPDEPEENPTDTQEPVIEAQPDKPEGAAEIIAFADELGVETSLLGFSLDAILPEVILSENEAVDADEYQNSTAYLGDSVTLGLSSFGNHKNELVIAQGSINPLDAVQKKLIVIDENTSLNFPDALARLDVERAVLTFGANAISIMSEEAFLNAYIMLIDEIQNKCPDCQIIIQAISPITKDAPFKVFTNELINRSNLLLLVLAYSQDAYFLNSAPLLKDDQGYLNTELCSSEDGVHINKEGYNIWIDYLKTHQIPVE